MGKSFLSWNLAMMETSDFAPSGWRMDETEAEVRKAVLRLNPDFVLLQELPGIVPFVETHDMVPANAKGQTGDIAVLARRELVVGLKCEAVEAGVLVHTDEFTLANVHLASGKGGSEKRLECLRAIRDAVKGPLAVIGDTNMRVAEEEDVAKLGLSGERPPQPTWNSKICRYRTGAREFTAYFTRALADESLILESAAVLSEPFEARGARFHISDHFALYGEIFVA